MFIGTSAVINSILMVMGVRSEIIIKLSVRLDLMVRGRLVP